MHTWNGKEDFPTVITIFSAPNYCDVYGNKGAIIQLIDDSLNIKQYGCVGHPFVLPNNMNVFTWSMPFVAEKIVSMLYNMIMQVNLHVDEDDPQQAIT